MTHEDENSCGAPDDESFAGLEEVLRGLPLIEPSAALGARVTRTLSRAQAGYRLRLAGVGTVAACVLVGAVLLLMRGQPRAQPLAGIQPAATPAHSLRIERNTDHLSDAGVIALSNNVPMHAYRYESVRRFYVIDPKNGSHVSVTVPREQIVLVPVRPL